MTQLSYVSDVQDTKKATINVETNAESSCFESVLEKCLPLRVRKNIPMIKLVLLTLWGVSSDTLLSIVDVGTDYKVGIDYLR